MAVAARAAALPAVERQDVTTAAPTRTIANRATAEAVTTTEADDADATTSAAGKVGMRLGPKIAAIFIPILFFLVVFVSASQLEAGGGVPLGSCHASP